VQGLVFVARSLNMHTYICESALYAEYSTLACNKALIALEAVAVPVNVQGSSRYMPESGFCIFCFLVL
jgi:hypothetical protein